MGFHARSARRLPALLALSALLLAGFGALPAHAGGTDEMPMDALALTNLEQRAATAEPRERCFLYSELLNGWTELASRSMAAGDDATTTSAITHADADAMQLKATLAQNSKRLKNAEQLLEHTARRLSDMVRVSPWTSTTPCNPC